MNKTQKANRDYYDKTAEIWAAENNNTFWYESQFRQFEKLFPESAKIIDIGCAWGIHVPLFLGIGRKLKYEGMDLSRSFLEIARRRFPDSKFYLSDVTNSSTLPKGPYDGFWAAAVLMHVPEARWPETLVNLEQICKPGAYGFISLPSGKTSLAPDDDSRHFSLWTREKFQTVTAARGWSVEFWGSLPERPGAWYSGWTWHIVRLPGKGKAASAARSRE